LEKTERGAEVYHLLLKDSKRCAVFLIPEAVHTSAALRDLQRLFRHPNHDMPLSRRKDKYGIMDRAYQAFCRTEDPDDIMMIWHRG